jgi:hypothetical protein
MRFNHPIIIFISILKRYFCFVPVDLNSLNKTKSLSSKVYLSLLVEQWKLLANLTKDSERQNRIGKLVVNGAIESYSQFTEKENNSKTLIIHVVETTVNMKNDRYKIFAKNMLCYAKHYNFKPIVYLVDKDQENIANISTQLKSLYENLILVDSRLSRRTFLEFIV